MTRPLRRFGLPPPERVGALTVCFALGQVVGPPLTGLVADGAGAVRAGLLLSAGILVAAAGLALWQGGTRASLGRVSRVARPESAPDRLPK